MSAEDLLAAAETMRTNARSGLAVAPAVAAGFADLLDEIAAWRIEGLGLMPDSNLADAWGGVERRAGEVAAIYLGRIADA